MVEKLRNFRFSYRTVPFAILGLCLLAFGPLITQLGYYWDDWSLVMVANLRGNFWEFFTYNRPISAWTYAFPFPVLGITPINWHVFAEVLWGLMGLALWWMLMELWPRRKWENAAIALLFVVHPGYLIHPIAVTLSQQYLVYLPFFLSMAAMLAAMRNPRRFWAFTIFALAMNALHAFSMEYFWGLELIRPVLIWMVLGGAARGAGREGVRARTWRTFQSWWPYLLVLGAAVIWRMFFVTLAADENPNELVLLSALASNPVGGMIQLLQMVVNDFVHLVIVRWYDTLKVAWFDLGDRFYLFVWGGVLVTGGVFAGYLTRLGQEEERGSGEVIFLGLFTMFAGGAAAWAVGRQLTVGLYADRYALPPLLGVVIFTVGVIRLVVRPKARPILLAGMLALAVGAQLRVQNDYRWDWVNQQRAFWQLAWRAPGLTDHTAVMADGSLFRYTGGYLTGAALNVLYPTHPGNVEEVSYWFFELDQGYFRYFPEMKAERFPMVDEMRQYSFTGTSQEGLLVYYAPDAGNCLWVITERDQFNPDLPALTKEVVALSNLDQIEVDATTLPSEKAFGAEPPHTWCYYFQKAELARQQEDWATVVALAEESAAKGYAPNNRLEWLPFVEAYAHTGDWERARDLSVDAWKYSKATRNLFCPIWRGFEAEGLDAPAGTFEGVYARLGCETGGGE